MLQKDNKINWMYYHFLTHYLIGKNSMKKKVTSSKMQHLNLERSGSDLLSYVTLGEKKLELIYLSTSECLVYPCIFFSKTNNATTENTISRFLPLYQKQEKYMRETYRSTSNFIENCSIVRPLLSVSRFEISKFCSFWQLPIYPDASNQKIKFLRNRVRKQVLPAVKFFFNSQIENVFLQFADIAEAEDQGMDQIAKEFFTNLSIFSSNFMQSKALQFFTNASLIHPVQRKEYKKLAECRACKALLCTSSVVAMRGNDNSFCSHKKLPVIFFYKWLLYPILRFHQSSFIHNVAVTCFTSLTSQPSKPLSVQLRKPFGVKSSARGYVLPFLRTGGNMIHLVQSFALQPKGGICKNVKEAGMYSNIIRDSISITLGSERMAMSAQNWTKRKEINFFTNNSLWSLSYQFSHDYLPAKNKIFSVKQNKANSLTFRMSSSDSILSNSAFLYIYLKYAKNFKYFDQIDCFISKDFIVVEKIKHNMCEPSLLRRNFSDVLLTESINPLPCKASLCIYDAKLCFATNFNMENIFIFIMNISKKILLLGKATAFELKMLNHHKVISLIVKKSLLLQRNLQYFQRHVPFLYTSISTKNENHFLLAFRLYEVSKSKGLQVPPKQGTGLAKLGCKGNRQKCIFNKIILHNFMGKNQKFTFRSSFQKTCVDLVGIPIISVKSSLVKTHKSTIKKLLFDKWVCKALQTNHYWFFTKYRTGSTFFLFNLSTSCKVVLCSPLGFAKHSFACTITPLYKKYSNKKFSFYFLENLRFLQKKIRLVSFITCTSFLSFLPRKVCKARQIRLQNEAFDPLSLQSKALHKKGSNKMYPVNCTKFASRLRFLSIVKPWELSSVETNPKKRIKQKTTIKLSANTSSLKRKSMGLPPSGVRKAKLSNSVKSSKKQKLYQVLTSTIYFKCSTIMSASPNASLYCTEHKRKCIVVPNLQIQSKKLVALATQRNSLKTKSILLPQKEVDFTSTILYFPRFSMSIKPSFWVSNKKKCTFNNTTTNFINTIFQSIDDSLLVPPVQSKGGKNALQLTNSDNKIENIFISNFLIYFKKLEIEKKNIYWPIILSFLPKSFQRRVAKKILVNQNKKNIRYSQIEHFLTLKTKLY